jgi:hypothetical protein
MTKSNRKYEEYEVVPQLGHKIKSLDSRRGEDRIVVFLTDCSTFLRLLLLLSLTVTTVGRSCRPRRSPPDVAPGLLSRTTSRSPRKCLARLNKGRFEHHGPPTQKHQY